MGQLDVDAMLATMSTANLIEWMAFDKIEPLDSGKRAEAGSAVVASILANVYRDPKKQSIPYTAADFIPQWGKTIEQAEPEDVWQKIKAGLGGKSA